MFRRNPEADIGSLPRRDGSACCDGPGWRRSPNRRRTLSRSMPMFTSTRFCRWTCLGSNSPTARTDFKGPMNTFVNVPEYPPADFKGVVRSNFDTLYSVSWLDMTKEPVVISAPDTDGRYYLLPMLDMWTDVFASPGWRTTGTKAGTFLVTPPGWRPDLATVPEGSSFRRTPSASKRRRLMSGLSAAPRPTARRIMMRSTKFRLATRSRCFPSLAKRPSR